MSVSMHNAHVLFKKSFTLNGKLKNSPVPTNQSMQADRHQPLMRCIHYYQVAQMNFILISITVKHLRMTTHEVVQVMSL